MHPVLIGLDMVRPDPFEHDFTELVTREARRRSNNISLLSLKVERAAEFTSVSFAPETAIEDRY